MLFLSPGREVPMGGVQAAQHLGLSGSSAPTGRGTG